MSAWLPALRLVAVYATLTTLLYVGGDRYSALLCEPIEAVLSAVPSAVLLGQVDTAVTNGQRVFTLNARTRDLIRTPNGDVPAGTSVGGTALQAYAHHHAILILAILVAWPVRRRIVRFVLLGAAVPAIALATMLDVPFALLGVAHETMLTASDPHAPGRDWVVYYFQFLQRGGRHLLSLVAAGLAIIVVSRRLAEETRAGRRSPRLVAHARR